MFRPKIHFFIPSNIGIHKIYSTTKTELQKDAKNAMVDAKKVGYATLTCEALRVGKQYIVDDTLHCSMAVLRVQKGQTRLSDTVISPATHIFSADLSISAKLERLR